MNGTLPDLDQLRCFVDAARTLNFRTSARNTACSPAAFSARIQALEELLGVRLFERSTRSVALTDAGLRLLPPAAQCLEAARALMAGARAQAPLTQLTLGTRYELGLSWLVPHLDPLAARRPGRRLHLVFGDSPELLQRALAGGIDAVITSYRVNRRDVVDLPLHPETYVFVGAPGALPKGGVSGPLDVEGLALIDASPDLPLFRYLLDARGDALWPFARQEHLGAISAIRLRVLQGAGLAVLPRYYVEADLQRGDLVALLPETRLGEDAFRLIWRVGHPLAAELGALGEDLRALPLG